MAVDIPDSITDLASRHDVTAKTPRKVSRARNKKIYADGSEYGMYVVNMDFDVLSDEQAEQLVALLEYANSTGDMLTLRLGVRSTYPTTSMPIAAPATKGSDTFTLSGLVPGQVAFPVGKLFNFSGHGKMYRAVYVPPADGSGNTVITFTPPLRSDENGTVVLDGVTFNALPPADVTDAWQGATGRGNSLTLEEWL